MRNHHSRATSGDVKWVKEGGERFDKEREKAAAHKLESKNLPHVYDRLFTCASAFCTCHRRLTVDIYIANQTVLQALY